MFVIMAEGYPKYERKAGQKMIKLFPSAVSKQNIIRCRSVVSI